MTSFLTSNDWHPPLETLTDFTAAVRETVDAYMLHQLSENFEDDRQHLSACMIHAVKAGGKRIRPILTLMAYLMISTSPKKIIPLAAAIEMLHAYSLIHDDLPAMDNDTLRRGLPTCHIAFGEATAILAGDTLNTFAFELLAKELPKTFGPDASLRALVTFAQACGIDGMAGGQMLDLRSEGKPVDGEQLKRIHALKTGALIRACFTLPGILVGVPEKTQHHLHHLGEAIGLLFQMVDDLLDEIGTVEALGKAVQKDSARQKATYVSLYGIEGTQDKITQQASYTRSLLHPFEGKASERIQDMIRFLAERNT